VFPGLYIGSMYAATDEQFLKDNNIKYILNVTEDGQNKVSSNSNIKYLCVPMRDEINFNAMKLFPKTCEFIDTALNSQKHDNILVHCQLGISRSATIVSAYLLYKYYEYDVLKYLQRKRPTIKPNEGFQRQLQLWQ
ncbi:hypothetical protein PIROE2DRAFT_27353, partial [Piromyces sp. E2]